MGRTLKKGDILEIDENNKINITNIPNKITNIPNKLDEINTSIIRINNGLQSSYFSDLTWDAFTSKMFIVSDFVTSPEPPVVERTVSEVHCLIRSGDAKFIFM